MPLPKITIKLAQGDEIKGSLVIRGGYIDYFTSTSKRSSFSDRPLVTYSLSQLAKLIEEVVRAEEEGIETIVDENGIEIIDDLGVFGKEVVEKEETPSLSTT